MPHPDDREPGMALGKLAEMFPGARISLWCCSCLAVQKFDIEPVVRKLQAEGIDGWSFGIRALAWRVTRPCARCGQVNYEARPDYPPAPGQGGP